jgi:5-methylcytosine-specific restriction endonuclease McrA
MPKLGYKQTEEHRIKLKNISIGRIPPSRLGSKMPKDAKEKISKYQKGNKWCLGKKASKETRKKMSLIKKNNLPKYSFKKNDPRITGKNNHFWKGGITPINIKIRNSVEYKLWRTAVFERDNYTCVWCGDNKGGNLEADHIKPFCDYPELRLAIDNGRTLCKECHRKTDTYPVNLRLIKKN